MAKKTAYEIVMESRKEIVDSMIQMMGKGELFWEQDWITGRPHNPVSGNSYKGGNFLRLVWAAAQNGFKDSRWMTMKNIQDKGWTLKKGSKGVACEKWRVLERPKRLTDAQGNYLKDADGKYITDPVETEEQFVVNYFKVFNAECVEGIPAAEKSAEDLLEARYLLENSPVPVLYGSEEPSYSTADDKIHFPNLFVDEAAKYSSFYRELVHATAVPSRMDRKGGTAEEALIAELGTVFLVADTSLPVRKGNCAKYLNEWISLLSADYNLFFKAAKEAEYAIGWISDVSGLEEAC